MTLHEAKVAVAFFPMIAVLGIGAFWFGAQVLNHQPLQTQTASATTDYFSWSCQQLKSEAQSQALQGDQQEYTLSYGGFAADHFAKATYLLQVMQLKGCSVSP